MGLEKSSAKGQQFLLQVLETNSVENGVGESQAQVLGSRALPQLGGPAQGAAVLRRQKADRGILEKRALFSLGMAGGSPKGWSCCVTMGSELPSWGQKGGPQEGGGHSVIYWASTMRWALGAVQILFAIHLTTWQNRCYQPYFPCEETGPQRLTDQAPVTQQVNGYVRTIAGFPRVRRI